MVVKSTSESWDERDFWENVEAQFEEKAQDFSKTLNIAVIGKVSSGKSSLINTLYYLYTGKILSSKAALAILPAFAAEAAGTTLFLFVTSFLPPTGAVNVAAASIAVSITLAILATVNSLLASGAKLEEEELLRSKFRTYRKQAETALKGLALTSIKDLSSIKGIIEKFL